MCQLSVSGQAHIGRERGILFERMNHITGPVTNPPSLSLRSLHSEWITGLEITKVFLAVFPCLY